MSIRVKLIIIFSILTILPMGIVGAKTYLSAKESLIENTLAGLWTTAEFKEGEIFLYLDGIKARTEDFASDGFIRDSLEEIDARPEDIAVIRENLNMHLIRNKKPLEKDITFIDVVDLKGIVAASTLPSRIGSDRSSDEHLSFKIRQSYLEDVHMNEDGTMGQEVSAPLRSRTDPSRVIGFLVNHYDSSVINGLLTGDLILGMGALTQIRGMGQTGETYLVNKDRLMVTDSLFVKNASFRQRVRTYPVEQCFQDNKEVKGVWVSYHGKRAAGASMCITIGGFRWALISEQNENETFSQISNLRALTVALGAVVVFLGGVMAFLMARVISDPIRKLTKASDEISSGRLDTTVEESGRSDEIGVLSRAFSRMVQNLRIFRERVAEKTRELAESELKIRTIFESTLSGIIVVNEEGMIDSFNSTSEKMFGYTAGEVIGKNIKILTPEPYCDEQDTFIRDYFKTGIKMVIGIQREFMGKRKDGDVFPLELFVNEMRLESRRMFVGVVRDITGRRKAEHELRVLSMAVDQSPAAVVITDVKGRIEYVNPQFVRTSGYTLEDAKGQKMNITKSGYMSSKVYDDLWGTITSGQEWRGELYNKKKSGELFWEKVSISPIKNHEGVITHFIGIQEDITVQKEYERRLVHEAHFDSLTKLPNRLLALDRLSQALVRARRKKQAVAVLYIDLDRFKMVNDTLGHPVGDELLVEAARRLVSSVRESDTVARLGGDEFLIILQDLQDESQQQIITLARKVLELFSAPFTFEGMEAFITASIGITIYPDDGNDVTVLLRNADAAMYKAKGGERNAFRFFTPEMNEEAVERMEMEHHLRHALEKKELSLCYQPLVEAQSGKVIGAEALLRWNNPELGPVPPDRFIPVAEDTGLIIPVTDWVLREACKEAKSWQKTGEVPFLRIAVNISSRHFIGGDLVKTVSRALEENNLSPGNLELEITERLLIEDPAKASRILYELNRMGVRLSIDDFGTGYSALSYLKEFPFQTLKVARAFIRGIIVEEKDAALVKTIIAMSHGMGLKVIGEGVETQQQLESLRSLGCDWIQGFYISKPLSPEQFKEFLLRV